MTRQFVGASWNGAFAGPAIWPSHATLLRQGELPPTVYALDEGAVKLAYSDSDGEEFVLDIREAPALIGGALVVAERISLVNVLTITPCTLRWCSAQTFAASLGDQECLSEAHRLHCTEIAELLDRVAMMSVKSSSVRLEQFLARHAANGDGSTRLHMRQSLLASLLNVTPEHLSRLLKKRMAKAESPSTWERGRSKPGQRRG